MSRNALTAHGYRQRLAELAAEINAAHEEVMTGARHTVKHAMRVGDLLIEAQKAVQYGKWIPWVAEHCKFSKDTSENYIHLAKHRAEIEAKMAEDSEHSRNLAIRGALRLVPKKPARIPRAPDFVPASGKPAKAPDYVPGLEADSLPQPAAAEATAPAVDSVPTEAEQEIIDKCVARVIDAIKAFAKLSNKGRSTLERSLHKIIRDAKATADLFAPKESGDSEATPVPFAEENPDAEAAE
jgi:hypothetical protein